MKKKNVKKVLPRPEYQSPYKPYPTETSQESQQTKDTSQPENNKTLNTEILYKEENDQSQESQDNSPYVPMSDSLNHSPYETIEEKIDKSKKLRGAPSHNPRIEKELAKKKQTLPPEHYASPFESEAYKNKQLYKEEEDETSSHTEAPSVSHSDSFYESPFDSIEEKMERVYYQKTTPSYNPVVEKELKRKKRNLNRDPSEEEYESPFESEEYKKRKLYKEEEDIEKDTKETEAPSLYQSPYKTAEEQRVHQEASEEYNSFDLPFIETRVTSHIRGSRVMDYAFENANMDEDQQEVHYRQMKYAKILLLLMVLSIVILLIVSLPPRLRHYQGNLGTYEIYHFQNLIVTPQGEHITYDRTIYQKALYYSFFMPDGEEVRTTSLHEGLQLHVGKQTILTEQEQDLYNAMVSVEEDYRTAGDSYEHTFVSFLIQVSHVTAGIVLAMCPYYLVDFSVFCYPASSPEFRTAEFLKKCRNFAIGYALFAMTPWGARLHTNLIMNTMGRVINQWAGIMYSAMGS